MRVNAYGVETYLILSSTNTRDRCCSQAHRHWNASDIATAFALNDNKTRLGTSTSGRNNNAWNADQAVDVFGVDVTDIRLTQITDKRNLNCRNQFWIQNV